jgi:4-amino-4-deoxy-L-arabinose transferase-like glycosyltransferase
MGWRMVEFPLYQGIGAGIAQIIPGVQIEIILRLVSIFTSVGTVLLLIILITRYYGIPVGLITGFVYSILPYSIYYGRTVLPDSLMVFFSLLSLVLLDSALSGGKSIHPVKFAAAAFSAAFALLVKPMAVFLLIPVIYLFWCHQQSRKSRIAGMIIFGTVAFLPFLFWRIWISQYPEGIPAFWWLFNEGNIRFKGAWFYWLFAERIGNLILGYWGLIPLGLGLTVSARKNSILHILFALSAVLYFIVIAKGNVQHDYYQILIIPTVSILLARGYVWMMSQSVNRISFWILALVSLLFMTGFSWYTIRTYYWINRPEILEAGKAADRLLPTDAKVIAPYNGDTTFLYQTGRQGWPIGFDIDKKISQGAAYYVTVSPTDSDTETKELAEKYTVLVRNDRFAIIDLTRKK